VKLTTEPFTALGAR